MKESYEPLKFFAQVLNYMYRARAVHQGQEGPPQQNNTIVFDVDEHTAFAGDVLLADAVGKGAVLTSPVVDLQ
jgi:hypothetical protein